jgi:hypothetical protein
MTDKSKQKFLFLVIYVRLERSFLKNKICFFSQRDELGIVVSKVSGYGQVSSLTHRVYTDSEG